MADESLLSVKMGLLMKMILRDSKAVKFIEDYLTKLFGVDVCDVQIDYHSPSEAISCYLVEDEAAKAVNVGRGMLRICVTFSAFSHELPHRKGSLLMAAKYTRYSNLSEYTYECLQGEETKKLFEYALGKEE